MVALRMHAWGMGLLDKYENNPDVSHCIIQAFIHSSGLGQFSSACVEQGPLDDVPEPIYHSAFQTHL